MKSQSNSMEKDGWLQKRTGVLRTWKKRWVVVTPESLFWTDEPFNTSNPEKTVPLMLVENVEAIEMKKGKSCFAVEAEGSELVFEAENDAERDDWVSAIEHNVAIVKQPSEEEVKRAKKEAKRRAKELKARQQAEEEETKRKEAERLMRSNPSKAAALLPGEEAPLDEAERRHAEKLRLKQEKDAAKAKEKAEREAAKAKEKEEKEASKAREKLEREAAKQREKEEREFAKAQEKEAKAAAKAQAKAEKAASKHSSVSHRADNDDGVATSTPASGTADLEARLREAGLDDPALLEHHMANKGRKLAEGVDVQAQLADDVHKGQKAAVTKSGLGGGAQVCAACGKKAYAAESVFALDTVWHKACFRCSYCKGQLSEKTYRVFQGLQYCRPHYRAVRIANKVAGSVTVEQMGLSTATTASEEDRAQAQAERKESGQGTSFVDNLFSRFKSKLSGSGDSGSGPDAKNKSGGPAGEGDMDDDDDEDPLAAIDADMMALGDADARKKVMEAARRDRDVLAGLIMLLSVDNPERQASAAAILCNLAFDDMEMVNRITELEGLPPLVALVSNANKQCQSASCATICNLCFKPENRLTVLELGLIPQLVQKIKSTDEKVKALALSALWSAEMETPDVKEAIVDSKAGKPLMKALKHDDSGVVLQAAGCVANLSTQMPEIKVALFEGGVGDTLLNLLKNDSDTEIRKQAMVGIVNMCAGTPAALAHLVSNGAVEAINELSRSTQDKSIKNLCLTASRALTR